jgi:hypothetical protein
VNKSFIVFDENNEIIMARPEPTGASPVLTIENCFPYRPNLHARYQGTWIEGEFLTPKAKKEYRIVNSQCVKKPEIIISIDKTSGNAPLEIDLFVEIANAVEEDNISSINLTINDASIIINIVENKGNQVIELTDPDTYLITCHSSNLRSNSVRVEVI